MFAEIITVILISPLNPQPLETVLSINNLTKHYGMVRALENLDLSIGKGQVFGILGPNGSGKTTTLGIVLGVINKTEGSYQWFGQTGSKAQRKKIGAILEAPLFYPYLSALKNLEIVALIKEIARPDMEGILKRVGLYERRKDAFRTYSLGMKQRLSIASALLCDPEVMILDEPTNGLDPQGIAEIRELITQIAAEGKTIILASHLLDEVQKVCSHFAVLKKGRLLHTGPVAEVTKGIIAVEVSAASPHLKTVLEQHPEVLSIATAEDRFSVKMSDKLNAAELNRYLFDQGIIASHLVSQKQSLEKQFLDLLKNSGNV